MDTNIPPILALATALVLMLDLASAQILALVTVLVLMLVLVTVQILAPVTALVLGLVPQHSLLAMQHQRIPLGNLPTVHPYRATR